MAAPLRRLFDCEKLPSKLYPLSKLRRQRVLGKDVKRDPLQAEEQGRLDHGEGLLQPVPAGHHSQVHDLRRPPAPACRSGRVTEQTGGGGGGISTHELKDT